MSLPADAIFLVIQKVWWFLLVLGILVTFHEFGHFIVARWAGVKVLKFSLGFGPKIYGRQIGETEYVLSAIPLGGYVKMFGEDHNEVLSTQDREQSFLHKPLLARTLIVAAGPAFNFLLSYIIFTGWLAIGTPLFVPTFQDLSPIVEAIHPDSPAALSGLRVGDRIIRVNQEPMTTQSEVFDVIAASRGKSLTVDVIREEMVKTFLITPEAMTIPRQKEPIYRIGIEESPALVTSVLSRSPAMAGGMQKGDRITRINEESIHTWSQMTKIVRDHPQQPLTVQVLREQELHTLVVTPEGKRSTENGQSVEIGKIGITGPGRSVMKGSSLLMAPLEGLYATWGWTELTVIGIYKILTGEISSKNIGGPIMIASISGEAAEQGIANVAFLVAILSINLGILNLLPIPVLDGGHLLFFMFEGILRHPLGERQRELAQQAGIVLLLSIMLFAFWNDIQRLLQ
ncbi:MAG: RIP metalloprotease RseP [Nitrospirales bacterium]|nr:RIP metalloprotease RseP [Nitrospirales bacterium]